MSWNVRALVGAAIAAVVLMAPSGLRWSTDVTAAGAAAVAPAQVQAESSAQDQAAAPDSESTQAADNAEIPALFIYSGGFARAKRVRTQTTAVSIGTPGFWRTLPNAGLQYVVPSGTADLLNVSFSAECSKVGGGQARIRVLDNGVGMQPYDGGQVFCSSGLLATHTGTWARRVGAGTHNIVVQFLNTAGSVRVDDWTLELVVYD